MRVETKGVLHTPVSRLPLGNLETTFVQHDLKSVKKFARSEASEVGLALLMGLRIRLSNRFDNWT